MNRGIFGHPRGNLRDGLQPFPSVVKLHPWAAPSSQSGSSSIALVAGRLYDAEFLNGGLVTDYLEWPVILAAGTWKLQVVGTQFTDAAILSWSLDGVVFGTIDQYAATAQIDVIQTITDIQVGSSGKKLLRVASSTKNASSSGFTARMTHISMLKTA